MRYPAIGGTETLADLFSMFHDGVIVEAIALHDGLLMRVEISYLAERIHPDFTTFEVHLYQIEDLSFTTWPNNPAAEPQVLRNLQEIFGLELEILSRMFKDGRVEVFCRHDSVSALHCGGTLSFHALSGPPHIGSPTPGCGYEDGDPYADFLPPPVETDEHGEAEYLRAVVFVTEGTRKGTSRSGQEYEHPLLVLTGKEYAAITFEELHACLCSALRGSRPRVIAQYLKPGGGVRTFLEDGTIREEGSKDAGNGRSSSGNGSQ